MGLHGRANFLKSYHSPVDLGLHFGHSHHSSDWFIVYGNIYWKKTIFNRKIEKKNMVSCRFSLQPIRSIHETPRPGHVHPEHQRHAPHRDALDLAGLCGTLGRPPGSFFLGKMVKLMDSHWVWPLFLDFAATLRFFFFGLAMNIYDLFFRFFKGEHCWI